MHDLDMARIRLFVEVARDYLAELPWDEIEPGLAINWEATRDAEHPPWSWVAELIKQAAHDELRG